MRINVKRKPLPKKGVFFLPNRYFLTTSLLSLDLFRTFAGLLRQTAHPA